MEHEFNCISCPFGCLLKVKVEGAELVSISGNRCKRGVTYAKQEATDPRRVFSTVVAVEGGVIDCVPVKLTAPVKKEHIFSVLGEVKKLKLRAPVAFGQRILENVDGDPNIAWVATRAIAARGEKHG
ncbi:MAG: DUF1667 domain-containing protein [Bradymonadales bacterium]